MTLAERLPSLDKAQLLSLQDNARRLSTLGGRKGEEAAALIPLIEAELAVRSPPPAAKAKRRVAAPVDAEMAAASPAPAAKPKRRAAAS